MESVVKPKTSKGKRFLEKQEPKLVENCKSSLFIRGTNANNTVVQALKDFAALNKPHSVFFNKKNDLRPFEDASSIEFFSKRNDASLFMFGSSNKKRPNNLVVGRLYDHQILDMIELGIENFKALSSFKTPKIEMGIKPMMLFSGDLFENDSSYKRLKNVFIDFFRGPSSEYICPEGLEHLILFHAKQNSVKFRSYRVSFSRVPGKKIPDISLEEIGPHMDFVMRRQKLASDDLCRQATKVPPALKPKKKKNIKRDPLGTTHGRIHMQRQDYSKLNTKKMKGLKGDLRLKRKFSVKTESNESPAKKLKQLS